MKSVLAQSLLAHAAFAADHLPSWHDGAVKMSIVEFVTKVTREGTPISSRPPPASRRSTTTARCGPSSRCISSSSSHSTA